MQLNSYMEKDFIQEILGPLATTAATGEFDDCVVIDLAEFTGARQAPYLVYSMDQPSFIRHADPTLPPYRFYGRWIVGTTCNDVVAMGGRCKGFSLALATPPESEVDDIVTLVSGITDALAHYGAAYEGGNLDSGRLNTVGFAWGLAPRNGIVRRSGARPGDRIAVTGEVGLGWLEHQLRAHGLARHVQPKDQAVFTGYKRMPVGAAAAIAEAADESLFTSGMDLSDGLVEFLHNVRARSGLGCVIDYTALPVAGAALDNLASLASIGTPEAAEAAGVLAKSPRLIALEPGYDSPLLHAFTLPAGSVGRAREIFRGHGGALHIIGEVVEEQAVTLRRGGGTAEIPPFWDDQLRVGSTFAEWAGFLRTLA